jgi:hypothetical protein
MKAISCPPSTVHCPLFTVHCPLFTVHCSLSTVHCPLFTGLDSLTRPTDLSYASSVYARWMVPQSNPRRENPHEHHFPSFDSHFNSGR